MLITKCPICGGAGNIRHEVTEIRNPQEQFHTLDDVYIRFEEIPCGACDKKGIVKFTSVPEFTVEEAAKLLRELSGNYRAVLVSKGEESKEK